MISGFAAVFAKGGAMVNQMRRSLATGPFASDAAPFTHALVFGGVNDLYSDETAGRSVPKIEADLAACLKGLGYRGDDLRRGVAHGAAMPGATLEDGLREALGLLTARLRVRTFKPYGATGLASSLATLRSVCNNRRGSRSTAA